MRLPVHHTRVRTAGAAIRVWPRALVVLCASFGCLLLGSVPALAAGPPTIEAETFSHVGSGSAMLATQIDPQGSATVYYYEYGPTSAYGSVTATVGIGAGESALPASAQLNDLAVATEYHFRVVARNADGETSRGNDTTFRTLPAGILGLPDGRVFERVTPAENANTNVYVPNAFGLTGLPFGEGTPTRRPFEAAVDGDAVVYEGDPSRESESGTGVGGNGAGNAYLATRSVGGGWTQIDLQPAGYFEAKYQAFSNDLSTAFLTSPSETRLSKGPPLAPQAPGENYTVPYARDNSDGSYHPFFLEGEEPRNEPSLNGGGGSTGFGFGTRGGGDEPPVYAGSSADLSVNLFEANGALTADSVFGGTADQNLYTSVNGRLSLVNVLPEGRSEPNATFGSAPSANQELDNGAPDVFDFSHVISADGSRIFWTDLNTGTLYVREDPTSSDARTVEVTADGKFWTATADGSKAFFTNGDLYEYNVESGQTADLTPGVEVQGVIGASENGEYIYYVDTSSDLRLWHNGSSTLIATLSTEDGQDAPPFSHNSTEYAPGDWQPGLGRRTAEVTPDGRSIVFMSNQSLKAVDYPDGYPNNGLEEVYVYDAEAGHLFCASCSSSGEPAQIDYSQETEEDYGRLRLPAAFVPVSWSNTYQPRWISENGGRVFFDSAEPLVSRDTNGKQDVYEWERDGVGSCGEVDGCIYLLSGGTGGTASWLLDTDAEGENVFIISRTPLVSGDPYDSFAVYDARVGGAQPPIAPACSGTGCQGVPPPPPIFATPASVTFDGVGNFLAPVSKPAVKPKVKSLNRGQKLARALKACRGKHGRQRSSCEAKARKRYGALSSKRSSKSAKGSR
jgi:hypothetical protein